MPKGEKLHLVRPPREALARRWGLRPFEPGEAGERVYIRAEGEALERFKALKPEERGRVVRVGLRALGLLEVQDAAPDEQAP
ncbi:hypothetical protein [Meiothermus rufus]|uniref:hypothetical protein n=1 Tax=Meiothermus rufus TaxID=604332 RepID=UPI0004851D6C|nr:hypothetical protein [Meiothermus rufus]